MKIKTIAQITVDRQEANLKQDISNLKKSLANAIAYRDKIVARDAQVIKLLDECLVMEDWEKFAKKIEEIKLLLEGS